MNINPKRLGFALSIVGSIFFSFVLLLIHVGTCYIRAVNHPIYWPGMLIATAIASVIFFILGFALAWTYNKLT